MPRPKKTLGAEDVPEVVQGTILIVPMGIPWGFHEFHDSS